MAQEAGDQDQGIGRMGRRATARLAWSLVTLSVALLLGGIALSRAVRSTAVELAYGGEAELGNVVLTLATLLTFSMVGAIVASRRPRNTIGWIFCSMGLVVGFSTLAGATLSTGSQPVPAQVASARRRRGSARGRGSPWYLSPRASFCCCSPMADHLLLAGGPRPGARGSGSPASF